MPITFGDAIGRMFSYKGETGHRRFLVCKSIRLNEVIVIDLDNYHQVLIFDPHTSVNIPLHWREILP